MIADESGGTWPTDVTGIARAPRLTLRVLVVSAVLLASSFDADAQISPQVETDARTYAERAMRHDSLLVKLNMKRITDAEVAEMDRMKAEGQQIAAKYSAGRATPGDVAIFERRRKELSASVVVPGVRRAIAAAFPEPDEVKARYQSDVDRAAAIQLLAEFLKAKTGDGAVPEAAAKLGRYEAAAAALDPGGRTLYSIRTRRQDPQFRFDALSQFVPVYADEAGGAGMVAKRSEGRVAVAGSTLWRAVWSVSALVFAVPVAVVAMLKLRTRPTGAASSDATPFRLPQDLRRINLLGSSLRVHYRCGQVTRQRRWTETLSVTNTQGQARDASGMAVQPWDSPNTAASHDPGTSTSSTIEVSEYTVALPNGKKETFELRGKVRDLEEGDLVSAAVVRKRGAICYDHKTGERFGNIHTAGRADRAIWVFTWVAAALGAYLAYGGFVEPQITLELKGADSGASYKAQAALYGALLLAIPFIGVIRKYIQRAREKTMDTVWKPRFEAYCKRITPELIAQYNRAAGR